MNREKDELEILKTKFSGSEAYEGSKI